MKREINDLLSGKEVVCFVKSRRINWLSMWRECFGKDCPIKCFCKKLRIYEVKGDLEDIGFTMKKET